MSFLWPTMLWLLAIVPVLLLFYWWLLARRKKAAISYANLAIVRGAMGSGQGLRRHLPPFLFLIAITLMIGSISRPTAVVTLPFQQRTVILAMDVSLSMRANDVEPTRLEAAQVAAREFVEDQNRDTRIGVVAFAGTASVVQPPTQSKEDIIAAIDRFKLQRGTAVGSGILVSLSILFPDAEFDLRANDPRLKPVVPGARPGANAANGAITPRGGRQQDGPETARPTVEPGSYNSAVIILLTDGQSTTGPDPLESARLAAERGVRVYTVGIGTPSGEIIVGDGWRMRVRLDEESLKGIASATRGEYFYAGTAADLKKVYSNLNSKFVLEKKETEITAFFAAAAAALALLSALLSLLWFNRIL